MVLVVLEGVVVVRVRTGGVEMAETERRVEQKTQRVCAEDVWDIYISRLHLMRIRGWKGDMPSGSAVFSWALYGSDETFGECPIYICISQLYT